MKFFKPEVCESFDDIEKFRTVELNYRAYLSSLKGQLPNSVLQLAEPSGMEDGLIVSANKTNENLKLVLRCGHLQMGYYNLEVRYLGVIILPEHDAVLAKIARSTHSQREYVYKLAYHELDLGDDRLIEHRLIFHKLDVFHVNGDEWPWFSIQCNELRWRRLPRRSRRLPHVVDRYTSADGA